MILRTTENIFSLAEQFGWKKWGKFTKKNGSSYQCFRQGNQYIWIGFRFIENSNYAHSLPYMDQLTTDIEIINFLKYEYQTRP